MKIVVEHWLAYRIRKYTAWA